MVDDCDRESQLSGCAARAQEGRKNINGSGVVILVALKLGKLFRSPDEPRPLGEEVRVGLCTQSYALQIQVIGSQTVYNWELRLK